LVTEFCENDFSGIVETLSQGLFVLDQEMKVVYWNRWMEQHARISRDEVLGRSIFELYPDTLKKGLKWKVDSVFKLGNYAFFSQRLHQYLFPMPTTRYLETGFSHMQQNVIIAPLHDQDRKVKRVAVSVIDNTDAVIYRKRLEETSARLEQMSRTDHLTGLSNRLHLMERLKEEVAFHERHDEPLSLGILDVDFFKKVNDTYGHICGDEVLIKFAQMFSDSLRTYDIIGRYGGEEFCLVLPKTPLEEAIMVLDRLRIKIGTHEFTWDKHTFSRTISIGVTTATGREGISPELLLQEADDALYRAKESGRNRIEVAEFNW
jgi:diguanylate cyclase (GGDEF)-like protein